MDRRQFSKSLFVGAAFAGAVKLPTHAVAATSVQQRSRLVISTRNIEVNGRSAKVYGLEGPNKQVGLELLDGEIAHVDLVNELSEGTMVHWHGLTPPWQQDGVPGMPMPLLKAGETRAYQLPTGKPGTHWMHAHTLQEQNLLAAPLIVRGKNEISRDEQEVVILLHDFSFTPATELLEKLRQTEGMGMMSQGMNHSRMSGRNMGGGMMGMDINDIEYDAYLANDRTLDDPEIVSVEKGGRVRIRIINGATATAFRIDTGVLDAEVIAVDGQDVHPMRATRFPLSMGQRVDLRMSIPKEGGAFPILALRERAQQRTGIILASVGAQIAKIGTHGEAEGTTLTLAEELSLVAASPLAEGAPAKSYTVNLLGNMQNYSWGMESNLPLVASKGDRVLIEMRNMSMMTHPMHLHGHHFQVVAVDGRQVNGAVRDTVFVPHMASVAIAFDADNAGMGWAFHCHHLYHMASGMMTSLAYEAG